MTAELLLSPDTLPLRAEDTIANAFELLAEFRVRHLPVVHEKQLLGVVSEIQLTHELDWDKKLGELILPLPVTILPGLHAYEVAKLMHDHNLTTIPVVDEDGHYVGLVERKQLYDLFFRLLGVEQTGAILVLDVQSIRDYSPARIAYLIEQTDAKILSLVSEPHPEGYWKVILKLNVTETARIRHVLAHHGYQVAGDFRPEAENEELQHRVEAFLRYLEV